MSFTLHVSLLHCKHAISSIKKYSQILVGLSVWFYTIYTTWFVLAAYRLCEWKLRQERNNPQHLPGVPGMSCSQGSHQEIKSLSLLVKLDIF